MAQVLQAAGSLLCLEREPIVEAAHLPLVHLAHEHCAPRLQPLLTQSGAQAWCEYVRLRATTECSSRMRNPWDPSRCAA